MSLLFFSYYRGIKHLAREPDPAWQTVWCGHESVDWPHAQALAPALALHTAQEVSLGCHIQPAPWTRSATCSIGSSPHAVSSAPHGSSRAYVHSEPQGPSHVAWGWTGHAHAIENWHGIQDACNTLPGQLYMLDLGLVQTWLCQSQCTGLVRQGTATCVANMAGPSLCTICSKYSPGDWCTLHMTRGLDLVVCVLHMGSVPVWSTDQHSDPHPDPGSDKLNTPRHKTAFHLRTLDMFPPTLPRLLAAA